jgi:hypothetical protein
LQRVDLAGYRQPRLQPIFMKAVARPRTGKPGIAVTLQLDQFLLSTGGGLIEHWVLISDSGNHLSRIGLYKWIETDENGSGYGQRL